MSVNLAVYVAHDLDSDGYCNNQSQHGVSPFTPKLVKLKRLGRGSPISFIYFN